ncbi:MAG: hypothetical protein HKM93_15400 [Desulfobacteraceae bacterium]|nr:hypothetical protein [Desulfobacteraceae bacterium]
MADISFLEEFIAETQDHVNEMESNLLLLKDADATKDLIDDIFRSVHTVKGSAEYLGMIRIGGLSHRLENLLDIIRKDKIVCGKDIIDICLASIDRINKLINELSTSQIESTDIEDLVADINELIERIKPGEGDQPLVDNITESTVFENDSESVNAVATGEETIIIEDEDVDEELMQIFIDRLVTGFDEIHDLSRLTAGSKKGSKQAIEKCGAVVESLKSSANYMGYASLCQLYEQWLADISDLEEPASSGSLAPKLIVDTLQPYMEKIASIFPDVQLKTQIEIPLPTPQSPAQNSIVSESFELDEPEIGLDQDQDSDEILDGNDFFDLMPESDEGLTEEASAAVSDEQISFEDEDLSFDDLLDGDEPETTLEFDKPTDNALLEDFIDESSEHLQDMESTLLKLHDSPSDSELINDVFRVIHTIKGSSEYMGLKNIARLSHHLENLLDLIRSENRLISEEVIDLLIDAKDILSALLDNMEGPEEAMDLEPILCRIQTATGNDEPADSVAPDNRTAETSVDTSLDSDFFALLNEDYDTELFTIFQDQHKDVLGLIKTEVTQLEKNDNPADNLTNCLAHVNQLISSANYMGYDPLCARYEKWAAEIQDRIDRCESESSPGIDEFLKTVMTPAIDKLIHLTDAVNNLTQGEPKSDEAENDELYLEEIDNSADNTENATAETSEETAEIKDAETSDDINEESSSPDTSDSEDTDELFRKLDGAFDQSMMQLDVELDTAESEGMVTDLFSSEKDVHSVPEQPIDEEPGYSSASTDSVDHLELYAAGSEPENKAGSGTTVDNPEMEAIDQASDEPVDELEINAADPGSDEPADAIEMDAAEKDEDPAIEADNPVFDFDEGAGDEHSDTADNFDSAADDTVTDAIDPESDTPVNAAGPGSEALVREPEGDTAGTDADSAIEAANPVFDFDENIEGEPFDTADRFDTAADDTGMDAVDPESDTPVDSTGMDTTGPGPEALVHELDGDAAETDADLAFETENPVFDFDEGAVDEHFDTSGGFETPIDDTGMNAVEPASGTLVDELELDETDPVSEGAINEPDEVATADNPVFDFEESPVNETSEYDSEPAAPVFKVDDFTETEHQESASRDRAAVPDPDISSDDTSKIVLQEIMDMYAAQSSVMEGELSDQEDTADNTAEYPEELIYEGETVPDPDDFAAEPIPAPVQPIEKPDPSSVTKRTQSLRVDAMKIDSLMNQVGELVVNRASLAQLNSDMRELQNYLRSQTGLDKKDLKRIKGLSFRLSDATVALGRVANDLQEGVMKVRMLPISQLFDRYPRLIHDLTRHLDKQVKLEVKGEETELDKMVIEKISDPLVHILRNSVDHGVELAADRRRAGKPERAIILLNAYHESNHVVIEITDDGRGLDTDKIKTKAIEQGLLTQNASASMTDKDIANLITVPGFSTADKVTHTSGRGVGMDVVKKNIEKLNGSLEIESEHGKGTRLKIKIPLTLAIFPALLVKVAGELYTIPLSSVEETIRLYSDELTMIEGVEVIHLRDEPLPLLRLTELFNMKTSQPAEDKMFVVVVSTGNNRVGLVVDSLIGQEEVVIKPLEDYLQENSGFSGATILGDGQISLILDIYELVSLCIDKRNKLLKSMVPA